MKKLIALLTLTALPVIGFAGVAHADEDNGTPPVNPTITHIIVTPGACTVGDSECGGTAPVNPTVTAIVAHPTDCPTGDPECNTPPTTVATGEDTPAPIPAVDTEMPARQVTLHTTTTHTPVFVELPPYVEV